VRILAAVLVGAALAALAVSATLAITGSDSSSDQTRQGKLTQIGEQPLRVRGNGFVAGEKVRVWATASGSKETRTVIANRTGSFTVSFSADLDTCNGVTVSAVGTKGTRTSYQLSQLVCSEG